MVLKITGRRVVTPQHPPDTTTMMTGFANAVVRGVTLAGWLKLDRLLTPYMFAVTKCHFTHPHKHDFFPETTQALRDECGPPFNESFPTHEDSLWKAFEAVGDSMNLPQENVTEVALDHFQHHYQTFITHADLQALSKAGVQHVRVPLPYEIRGDPIATGMENATHNVTTTVFVPPIWSDPFDYGPWRRFIRLLEWCKALHIKVWIDLRHSNDSELDWFRHAEEHNSTVEEDAEMANMGANATIIVDSTLVALRRILVGMQFDAAHTYAEVLEGVIIGPPPLCGCQADLQDFYQKAIPVIRDVLDSDKTSFFRHHDQTKYVILVRDLAGFVPYLQPLEPKDVEDEHVYIDRFHHPLPPYKKVEDLVQEACNETDPGKSSSDPPNAFVSFSMDDNMRVGPEYDKFMENIVTRERSHGSSTEKQKFLITYLQLLELQMRNTAGWFYYAAKTDGGPYADFDFLRGIREGWIPTPLPTLSQAADALCGKPDSPDPHSPAATSEYNHPAGAAPTHPAGAAPTPATGGHFHHGGQPPPPPNSNDDAPAKIPYFTYLVLMAGAFVIVRRCGVINRESHGYTPLASSDIALVDMRV